MSDANKVEGDPRENHNRFIASLEKHGFGASAWELMGKELDWTAEDVKTYAYRYFISLQKMTSEEERGLVGVDDNDWAVEENILFEALLVQYLPTIQDQSSDWAERIAAQMPGRTPREVNQRYEAKYRQQQGTHRYQQEGQQIVP